MYRRQHVRKRREFRQTHSACILLQAVLFRMQISQNLQLAGIALLSIHIIHLILLLMLVHHPR